MKSEFTRVKISNPLDRAGDVVDVVAHVDLSFPHLLLPVWLARKLDLSKAGS